MHDDLQSLRQSILDRVESIEDGSYWDDPEEDDWEIDYYDDEPDILNESHKTELAAFFDVAGAYFLQNRLPESRKLYKSLFELVGEMSMFTDYTRTGYYFDAYCHNAEKPVTTFAGEIKKGLPALDIGQEKFTEYIPQTLKYGEKRVEYIVSNKYRNAYGRAASVLGAMAEMHVARGDALKARKLVHTFYFDKFNRFAAFRTEVRAALAKSPLLKEVQKLLEK